MKLKSEMLLEDLRAAHAHMAKLRETLEAVERELEGVRKVEAWVQAGNTPGQPEHNLCGFAAGYFGAVIRRGMREEAVARGRTLAALGHALPDDTAQEGE